MKYTSKESKLLKSSKTMEVSIGLADAKKAIELLYSQYRFPIQTCVQELLSNAFDAMSECGRSTPVDVQIPDALNDFTFSVRDYADSMDFDTIKNVYMKVNASLKTKNNDSIGGFGIGSKTPWSYTDTFILTTYVNGLEMQYLMAKGRSSISIIHKGETTEPNGTRVHFQTLEHDTNNFEEAITRISLCSKIKPNITNGDLVLDFEKVRDINSYSRIVRSNSLRRTSVYANLGGVLYNLSDFGEIVIGKSLLNDSTLIVDFPIGSLSPLQTREGLFTAQKEGANNKAMIKCVLKRMKNNLTELMDNRISEVVNINEAVNIFKNELFKIDRDFTFNGVIVNSSFITLPLKNKVTMITRKSKSTRGKNITARKETTNTIRLERFIKSELYFSDLSPHKARLCSRFREITGDHNVYVIESDLVNPSIINTLREVKELVNIETVEIPKKVSTTTRVKVDSNRIVIYHQRGIRLNREIWLDKDYDDMYVVYEKGTSPNIPSELFHDRNYRVICASKRNVVKLLEKKNFFTENEAFDIEHAKNAYVLKMSKDICSRNRQRFNPKMVDFLSENKRGMVKSIKTNLDFYSNSKHVVQLIKDKYNRTLETEINKQVKRRLRVVRLSKVLPLFEVVNVYSLSTTMKQDLRDYVISKVGE